jgi:hypothetical protein
MTTRSECLSDLKLDLLLTVEFVSADEGQSRAHLADCARCSARLAELEQGRAAFEDMQLPLEVSGSAAARTKRYRFRWLGGAGAIAAAALGVVVSGGTAWLGLQGGGAGARGPHDRGELPALPGEVRSKGRPLLDLYIRHDGRVREAGDREPVHADDQLQFAYSSATAGYVAVLSRDGSGVVSVYVPSGAAVMAPAPPGERRLLAESTILDAALGHEDVYALFCSSGLELGPLARALREQGGLEAPEACSMRHIELDKRERR